MVATRCVRSLFLVDKRSPYAPVMSEEQPTHPKWLIYSQALLRFLLELAAIGLLAFFGFTVTHNIVWRIVLGIGLPALAIFMWGRFVAPRAKNFLPLPGRLLVEFVIFGGATAVLWWRWNVLVAVAFAVLASMNSILVHLERQDERLRKMGKL